jgi:hypothetical protein
VPAPHHRPVPCISTCPSARTLSLTILALSLRLIFLSALQNDRVEIIANDQGNRTTPSIVSFSDTERFVGEAALGQAAMNAANTIFDAKRLIGRKFSDPIVQADMKLW